MNEEVLSSAEALKKIVEELTSLLEWYNSQKSVKQVIVTSFSMTSHLPWPYMVLTLIAIFAFAYSATLSTCFCSLLLVVLLGTNAFIALWHSRKKHSEISARIRWCIENLEDVYDYANEDSDCLHLVELLRQLNDCETSSITSSPSHSISYVFRKNIETQTPDEAVPVPTTLLASGDVIALWLGQESPAKVECAEDKCCVIGVGDVLSTSHQQKCIMSGGQSSLAERRFRVLESPILEEIKKCLTTFIPISDVRRPPPILFERQKIYLLHWFLRLVIPAILIVTYITSAARYMLLPGHFLASVNLTGPNGSDVIFTPVESFEAPWYIAFIKIPALMFLPFLPVMLPGLLTVLLAIGEAKTLAVAGQDEHAQTDRYLSTPLSMSSQAIFLENQATKSDRWRKLFPRLLCHCDGTMLPRNAGLFTSLGSLTVLCCVDKEGILSWFNPVAEKVFFFHHERRNKPKEHNQDEDEFNRSSFEGNMAPVYEEDDEECAGSNNDDMQNDHEKSSGEENCLVSETLTLSQDSTDPSQIHFDDVKWEEYLPSLKPIGLNTLLNLCICPVDRDTLRWSDSGSSFHSEIMDKLHQKDLFEEDYHRNQQYLQLHAHDQQLCSIAYSVGCVPPKTNNIRMGSCSLAELIGFVQDVKIAYSNKQSFTAFRKPFASILRSTPSPKPVVSNDGGADGLRSEVTRTLSGRRNRWNYHLPYLNGTLVQDMFGDEQVLVYGAGDLIAEHCRDVWNGREIVPITNQDRKKAVDFYQRSSMAGHCVAFAFMPLLPAAGGGGNNSLGQDEHLLVNLSKDKAGKGLRLGPDQTEVLNHLIFLGMTALQFQARFSVCQMVDTLDRACIRFVHFSADDEVRSRVFAEKMGLETGWNCHISLGSSSDDMFCSNQRSRVKSESSKSRSSSEGGANKQKAQAEDAADEGDEMSSPSSHLLERFSPRTQSESSASDSLFNVSNRAKLPRGIENIVPHIENVDNVPLLVPLFTDATPETAHEMIQIMQDYGEVVCCVGSSDCIRNMSVFNQANVSLALEPLVRPGSTFQRSERNDSREESPVSFGNDFPGLRSDVSNIIAMKLARKLHTFPCPLLLSGDNSLSTINAMITQARHFLLVLRIFIIFLVKCQISLALCQLIAYILLLPAPFTPVDLFWLSFVALPFLSLSLLGSPPDVDLMTWANQKTVPKESPVTSFMLRQSTKRFIVKFLPSVLVLSTCYALCLHSSCLSMQRMLTSSVNTNGSIENATVQYSSTVSTTVNNSFPTFSVQCYPIFTLSVVATNSSSTTAEYGLWDVTNRMSNKQRAIQLLSSCFFVVYMCVISVGYVHRWRRLTGRLLCLNKLWCITVIVLICCQIVGAVIAFIAFDKGSDGALYTLVQSSHPPSALYFGLYESVIWTILLVWPLPCLAINELWKWREIKMWNRGQKRARLDFGTKLGMNSPF